MVWLLPKGSAILLSLLLIVQMIVPSVAELSAPAPLQSATMRLLGPNGEMQPVVNEGNSIKLTLTDSRGTAITSGVTFTSGSPDVASVDAQGNVRGNLFGFATITARTNSGASVSIFVVVARVQNANGMMVMGQSEKDNTSGFIYLSDPIRHQILRKDGGFAPARIFAGTGSAGDNEDESPLATALFRGPIGVAVDSSAQGGVFIADTLNHKIKLIANGRVRTMLGTGSPGVPAALMSQDEVTYANATDIGLNSPQGIAVGTGGLYIADTDNSAIYQVDVGRKRLRLFAGQPGSAATIDGTGRQARFNRPVALNFNSTGNVLNVLDRDNQGNTVVRQVTLDGQVRTVKRRRARTAFDDGIMPLAEDDITFRNARSISSDGAGNIYVVDDSGANLITFPANQDPQIVSLAQPGQGVTFNQATSVTVRGTQSFVVDASAGSTAEAVKIVSVGAPRIDSLNQTSARLEGGAEIEITGRNFAPETQLILGDRLVTDFIVESATTIRFRVPAQVFNGNRTLTVTTRGGVDQRLFIIVPKPFSELADGEITTVAGGVSFVGDGSMATGAHVALSAVGVAMDLSGNLFIADMANSRVRRVDAATGIITTVAGNGNPGFSGDGGPASAASLNAPMDVAVDSAGHLFIADRFNNNVRRVDAATGIITTVAGSSLAGFSGDGGPALGARMFGPGGLAVDAAGNLFIADTGNGRVRRVDAATGIINTVAGGGSRSPGDGGLATDASFFPFDVVVDGAGHLLISTGTRIQRVDALSGIITTLAGNGNPGFSGDGGPATNASFFTNSLAIDSAGNIFIADPTNNRIRRIDARSRIITTVAGNIGFPGDFSGDGGPAGAAGLRDPQALVFDGAGNFFIADNGNSRIRRVDAITGTITTLAGNGTRVITGEGGPATVANLNSTMGLTFDRAGNLIIAAGLRVRRVDSETGIITTVAGNGSIGSSGDGGPATAASLFPLDLAFDAAGNLFIAAGSLVRRVDSQTGIITTVAGNGLEDFSGDGGPALTAGVDSTGLALDRAGNLFIAELFNNRVRRVDAATGIITTVAGNGTRGLSGDGGAATAASLSPKDVFVDAAGNLFIGDLLTDSVRRVDAATGIITTVAGNGTEGFGGDGGPATAASLNNPNSVIFDDAGNLYIADTTNGVIRGVDAATGIIRTVAGTVGRGFGGDGGPATEALFNLPNALAFDAAGNLYISDSFNNRIRVVKGVKRLLEPSDFSLNFNPASIAVDRGQQGLVTVAINRTGLFTGNVTVTAPNASAAKIKITPASQSTTAASVSFNFKVKKKARVGAQQLQFTGRDDTGRVRTATLTLVVQ